MQPALPTSPPSDGDSALLRVSKLSVTYGASSQQPVPALREVSFDIAKGEIVGVLGESGCGKSTLALSLLGLLPPGVCVAGEIVFREHNLLRLNPASWRSIRGAKISLIHQEPGLSLSPVMRVGDQVAEVLRAHGNLSRRERREQVKKTLYQVQLRETDRVYNAYPHQLSGGELHRIVIAQALACRPDLVIADESTRALDVRTQVEILTVLRELNQQTGTAILFITHNPASLAGFAKRTLIMYAGRIVEQGSVAQVFRRPLHPYTAGLLELVPQSLRNNGSSAQKLLPVIPGGPPTLDLLGHGCDFEPRCSKRMQVCESEHPGELVPEEGRRVSCFVYGN